MGFEYLDHTADVGIVATGRDLKEAFSQAALGFFNWIVELETVQERESRQVQVASRDRESLLVDWLNELNYLVEAHGFIFRRAEVVELEGDRLTAVGYGEKADARRHRFKGAVKGATYHMLQVHEGPGGCRVQVILDI